MSKRKKDYAIDVLKREIEERKCMKESYDSQIYHCPVCQTLCEIKNCYEDENIYRFEPLVSFTPTEIQFITDRLEELIEEWDVPDMVFMAHQILKKIEQTLKNSEANLKNESKNNEQ